MRPYPTRQGNSVVGLEIGTTKICVAVGEATSDGTTRILGVAEAPSAGVSEGEIVDFEAAVNRVREAIADAEDKSQVQIRGVYLAVTGAHIHSFNTRGTVMLPADREKIDERDLARVRTNAREVSLPPKNAFLHSIPHYYRVDGVERVLEPIGMTGRRLEAEFHIIHGVTTQIQKTIRCVKELGLDLEDVVFAPLASSQVLLNDDQRNADALVIDIGGGTTDYILYVDGAVTQSGALAFGGDNITKAVSMRLRIPFNDAETLKIARGDEIAGKPLSNGALPFAKQSMNVGNETAGRIVHSQLNDLFELLKEQLEHGRFIDHVPEGIFMTGGCSLFKGIGQLAEAVFGVSACVVHPKNVLGLSSVFEAPQFSTAIGLIEYAKAREAAARRGLYGPG
jgi:cell division protein FtsA